MISHIDIHKRVDIVILEMLLADDNTCRICCIFGFGLDFYCYHALVMVFGLSYCSQEKKK